MSIVISLVIPVLNEEDSIPLFYQTVREYVPLQNYHVELVFCNDGSTDQTETLLNQLAQQDEWVKVLHFTRNFGKESALFAGLEHATGQAVIPIDVDLQDPIELIPKMLAHWQAGASIVLAKRMDRSEDHPFKRWSANLFYRIHNKMSNIHIEENVGDFRLLSRSVVDTLITLPERNLFMKGIFAWVGGDTAIIGYHRPKRAVGQTKFNGWKLWNLALEGISGFSTIPLRIWTYLGLAFSSSAFLYGLWIIVSTLVWGNDVKGYPSLLACILFLGGIQLISIGVLGEYIGRIYVETKQRPRYVLKSSELKKESQP